MFAERLARIRTVMVDRAIDVLLLSVGADLPYFSGYEATPLERLTLLVVPADEQARLLVPMLEVPRVRERPEAFELVPWEDSEDPIAKAVSLIGRPDLAAVGDQMWSGFLLDLTHALPATRFIRASEVTAPLRSVKDSSEVEALRAAGAAVDRIAADLQAGAVPLVGRAESDVAAEIGRRILDEGHHRINFVIVASGENSASPHHEPGSRVIQAGEVVLFDFGGTMADSVGVGYCSDITRCVHVGEPSTELSELYELLLVSQQAGIEAVRVGESCEKVDATTRSIIEAAGYGQYFIHRTGHGIGVEAHEHPNIVVGNKQPLAVGHAFSIEPGIYLSGQWGIRLEDIVVVADDGPDLMNRASHQLAIVDG